MADWFPLSLVFLFAIIVLAAASPNSGTYQDEEAATQENEFRTSMVQEGDLGVHDIFRDQLYELLNPKLHEFTQHPPHDCHVGIIGYDFRTYYNLPNAGADNGELLSMQFHKWAQGSILHFTLSTNILLAGSGGGRWKILIDGQPCMRPAELDMMFYQGGGGRTHVPAVLSGYCTRLYTSVIGPGIHTISVNVEQVHGKADIHTGYDSTTTLEVREVCPPY